MTGSTVDGDTDAVLEAAHREATAELEAGRPDRALAALDPGLARVPDDPPLLTLGMAAARMAGRIDRAREMTARLLQRMPMQLQANALAAAMDGRPGTLPLPPGGDVPVPFLLIDDALPRTRRDAIWNEAFGIYDSFTPATVIDEDGRYSDDAVRSSKLIETAAGSALEVVDRVRAELDRAVAAFGLDGRPEGHAEVQVTWHGDGDFFRCHQDRPNERVEAIDTRAVSFVYYMTRTPRPFTGGELRLYDWLFGGEGWRAERWTLVEPVDNRLIVFPSNAFHEVRAIALPSRDPEDGRLTVNGWIHRL